jgi:recombination protein RecT
MTSNTAVAKREPQTLKTMLRHPLYTKRFEEILGKRSAQFVSSVLSVGSSLGSDCDPSSIIASAMTAATLDLPVDKNLGFAWIVPYKKGDHKLAQFQMGYKGYIQLGLRTGQYERMNARVVNKEAFQGWDEVGEPIIDWSKIDESQAPIGYVFAFKLVNGFTKIAFWPKERVETHAKRFSQSYKGKYQSPWDSNFDAMALKTVVKNELAKWGILSIEMVNAIKHDQATKESLDSEPEYLDGNDINGNGNGSDPDAPPKITEEQRTALVAWAQEKSVIEKLGEIVTGAGFAMLADITIDKFNDVHDAITRAGDATAATTATATATTAPATTETQDDSKTAPAMDKKEKERADLMIAINDLLAEVSGGNSKKLAELTEGRDIPKLSTGQLKDFRLELEKKRNA